VPPAETAWATEDTPNDINTNEATTAAPNLIFITKDPN
jgi:hypothetical protein